jgi:small subunit ribosomal protein S1
LVHVSELSWRHVDHPSEVVQVGQEIEVEVLSVEPERDRVSLSLKNTQEDPWQAFARAHGTGDTVTGTITKLVPFGAFIKVADGIEGLAHISELAEGHIEVPEQVVQLGQQVQVRVIDVELDRRRISLSLKQAGDGSPTRPTYQAPAPPAAAPQVVTEPARVPDFELESGPDVESEFELESEPFTPPQAPPAPAPEPTTEAAPEAEADKEELATPPEPEPEPEPAASGLSRVSDEELEGELLDRSPSTDEESLEAIVETMKRDRT